MHFSEVMSSLRGDGGNYVIEFGDDWLQGHSVFGGLIVGAANRAMRRFLDTDLPLRQISTVFITAIHPGELEYRCTLLRRGKSVIMARCDVFHEGHQAATMNFVFGRSRDIGYRLYPENTVPDKKPEDIREVRYIAGRSPTFSQYFGHRWAEGSKPMTGGEPKDKIFLRHKDLVKTLSEEHIIAMSDASASPVGSAIMEPTVSMSLTWTIEILHHKFDYPADAWFRIDNTVNACQDGYVNETELLIGPDSVPLALGHQCVVVYTKPG